MNGVRRITATVFFLFLACFAHSQVKYGSYVVKDYNRLAAFPVYLSGTWQFYIGKMPETVPDTWLEPPDTYIPVPSSWNATLKKFGVSGLSTNTYRIFITKLKPNVKYAFFIKDSPGTSAAVYANGKQIYTVGVVAENISDAKPARRPMYAEMFSDERGQIELIFQITNSAYRKGGMWDAVRFGEADSVYREYCASSGVRLYIIANLLVLALYNLVIFLLDRRKMSMMYFSFFVTVVGIRIGIADFSVLAMTIPSLPFALQYKAEYLAIWMAPTLVMMFCNDDFCHHRGWRTATRIIAIAGAVLGVFATFLPIRYASYFVDPMLLYVGLSAVYVLVIAIRNIRRAPTASVLVIVDMLILLTGGITDMVITMFRTIFPVRIMPYSMLLFAVFQFMCITIEQSKMFAKNKNLVADLKELNEASVRFVPKEFLRLLKVKDLFVDVYLGNHVDVEMSIVFSQMYFERYEGCEDSHLEDRTEILSEFFRRVSPQIADNGGFVSKFISQGFMALFPNNPEDAIECCESIVHSLDEINIQRREQGKSLLKIGMGVHYGKMILGMIGEENRLDDTVISDTVNTASRIENYAEKQKLSVVVSETIVNNTSDNYRGRYNPLGEIKVKGKALPLLLSEFQI